MPNRFALNNPLSEMLDKTPDQFTLNDMILIIEKQQIERLIFHYPAIDGKLKELKLPIANRYQAERILTNGERVDGSSLFKGMVDVSLSDLYVVPLYKSAFLNPFGEKSLHFICRYFTSNGERAPFAMDTILHLAHQRFKTNTGLELHALGELEFFLLSEATNSSYPKSRQSGYHASGPFNKTGRIVDEMVHHLTRITGAVKYAHSEVGYVGSVRSDLEEIRGKQAEQLEIEFLPTPVEDTADNLLIARWLIRNVAFRHGCVATFAPKLEEGVAGNGLHFHMELHRNGQNVMTDEQGSLTPEAKKLIGGLCTYADTLTAFGNTESAAYLRLVPNQEAPTRICWSDLNRSAMIRVPLGWGNVTNLAGQINAPMAGAKGIKESRQTVELRSPDGSALIILLLAGITMAADQGLTADDSLDLAEKLYVKGNIFKDKKLLRRLPELPRSCVESAHILRKKRGLYERDGIFPSSVIDYVAKLLEAQQDEKMNEMLADLPADDRLHATRKIMHHDLHRH